MSESCIRDFLTGLIDYAGLFPPASLGMENAVADFRECRAGKFGWAMGHFIVPVSRLAELGKLLASRETTGAPWLLSVLTVPPVYGDLDAILEFNAGQDHARVDTVEIKISRPEDIRESAEAIAGELQAYYEVPAGSELPPFIRAIKAASGRAKIRTGGVMGALFPSGRQILDFLDACMREGVPFKATSGLHHALPGSYPLTRDRGSATAAMNGFLNLFLAAVFLFHRVIHAAEAEQLLALASADALSFDPGGVRWGDWAVTAEQLRVARRDFAVAFGSCSFREPITDLQTLRLL
jgi:hypothetical protein